MSSDSCDKKSHVCIISSEAMTSLLQDFAAEPAHVCRVETSVNLASMSENIDIFIVDTKISLDPGQDIRKQLLSGNPGALILGMVEDDVVAAHHEGPFDWSVKRKDLGKGIADARRILKVIRTKSQRAHHLDEALLAIRKVKHDASNALAIAFGAAGRLAKLPDIADNKFYQQLSQALDSVTEHVRKLGEVQDKYK